MPVANWNSWYAANPEQSAKRRHRQQDSRRAKRAYINECKDKPCMDCSVEYPPYVMDFDHRVPSEKKYTIAKSVDDNVSWDNLKAEIVKCDVVCANCHRKRTFKNKNFGGLV